MGSGTALAPGRNDLPDKRERCCLKTRRTWPRSVNSSSFAYPGRGRSGNGGAGCGNCNSRHDCRGHVYSQQQYRATCRDDIGYNRCGFPGLPVSGGVEGARNGTLAMMAGGDPEVLARAQDTLGSIAATITLIGPTGSGQACKAVNQIMCAGVNQAVTEALAFGEAMGWIWTRSWMLWRRAPPATGSWTIAARPCWSMITLRGFKLNLHHKDLAICKAMLKDLNNISLPLVDTTLKQYEQLMGQGYGDEDISALYRLKRPRK